jgi:hypothetical protein
MKNERKRAMMSIEKKKKKKKNELTDVCTPSIDADFIVYRAVQPEIQRDAHRLIVADQGGGKRRNALGINVAL